MAFASLVIFRCSEGKNDLKVKIKPKNSYKIVIMSLLHKFTGISRNYLRPGSGDDEPRH